MSTDRSVSFNLNGYDPFIDYLKAYSIFFVVFAHCLPVVLYKYTLFEIWGDMQVPMFILIQTFHAYKKNIKPKVSLHKLFKRIIIPFIAIQTFIFAVIIIHKREFDTSELLKFIIGGVKDLDHITFGYTYR